MSLPVSIGDALLLAQIAYNLGKACTSGRRAAPAEFANVRNLLYTLGDVLRLVSQEEPDHAARSDEGRVKASDAVIIQCVANCRPTLDELQKLVDKYAVIDLSAKKTEPKSWKDGVKRNWRKVAWTREEPGLDRLQTHLASHINSLNLALSTRNRAQGSLTFERVDAVNNKLDEICQWFATTLKQRDTTTELTSQSIHHLDRAGLPDDQPLTFSVRLEVAEKAGPVLLCPQASFHEEWSDSADDNVKQRTRLFECGCAHSDKTHRLHYQWLPISLLIRTGGENSERQWQIYAGSSDSVQPVSLRLTSLSPSMTNRFQQMVDTLSLIQAGGHMRAGLSTTMISVTTKGGDELVSILDLKPETSSLFGKLVSAEFEANGRRFTAPGAESCHLLHYRCIRGVDVESAPSTAGMAGTFRDLSHVDLVILGSGQSHNIKLFHETSVRRGSSLQEVVLSDVTCVAAGESDNDDGTNSSAVVQCARVTWRFQDFASADRTFDLMQSTKRELRIMYLRSCRWTEQIMFRRALGDVMIREFFLRDALLDVVLNPASTRYRLIVSSACGSMSVCTELPEDFVSKMAAGERVTGHDLISWFVQITDNGIHVTSRPAGGDFRSMGLLERSVGRLAIEQGPS